MDLASAGIVYSTLDVALSKDADNQDFASPEIPVAEKRRCADPVSYFRQNPRVMYAAVTTVVLLVVMVCVVAGVVSTRTARASSGSQSAGPTWWSWDHEQSCSPALFLNATTEGDVLGAIATAKARGLRLKVVGSGHSFSPIDLTGGVMLSLVPPPITSPDAFTLLPGGGAVRVHAGLAVWQVSEALQAQGLCLANLGAISMQVRGRGA